MREQVRVLRNQQSSSWIVGIVSLISVLATQLTLSMLPVFFPTLSILLLIPLSVVFLGVVLVLSRFFKKIAGVRASAPAFVFFTILFVWAVYFWMVRQAISPMMDLIFNIEILLLIVGLCCFMKSDPGYANFHSSQLNMLVRGLDGKVEAEVEVTGALRRVRYCPQCKNHVKGFDHHCPAFGNCIGQRNHFFFLVLLVGFFISEATFVVCSFEIASSSSPSINAFSWKIPYSSLTVIPENVVVGSLLFCIIQEAWKVVFIMWHIYCACFNIKTDEWINWRKYPEFQMEVISHYGEGATQTEFKNPYHKGILQNLKEFLRPQA